MANINNQSTIAQAQLQPIEHVFNGMAAEDGIPTMSCPAPYRHCSRIILSFGPLPTIAVVGATDTEKNGFRITFIVCMLICPWMRPKFSKGTSQPE